MRRIDFGDTFAFPLCLSGIWVHCIATGLHGKWR